MPCRRKVAPISWYEYAVLSVLQGRNQLRYPIFSDILLAADTICWKPTYTRPGGLQDLWKLQISNTYGQGTCAF